MTYEDEIALEESAIANLQRELKQIRIPRRTINWQFQNGRVGVSRGIKRNVLIVKKQRRQVLSNIQGRGRRIISLRQAIFGRDNPTIVEEGI